MKTDLALIPMWYIAFLLSTTCHEAAHAWAAHKGGDSTAFHQGQVSISPLPHIQREPFGMVVVPIMTLLMSGWMLGWGSAPYDPTWQARHPHRAAWMALAGPASNLLLAISAGLLIKFGISAGFFVPPHYLGFTRIVEPASAGMLSGLAVFVSIMFSLNVLLFAFNLLPLPPLDGNTAIGLLMTEDAALRFAELSHNPSFGLIGLLLAWKVFDFVFPPVFQFAIHALYF